MFLSGWVSLRGWPGHCVPGSWTPLVLWVWHLLNPWLFLELKTKQNSACLLTGVSLSEGWGTGGDSLSTHSLCFVLAASLPSLLLCLRGCKQKLAMVFVEFLVGWGVFLLHCEDKAKDYSVQKPTPKNLPISSCQFSISDPTVNAPRSLRGLEDNWAEPLILWMRTLRPTKGNQDTRAAYEKEGLATV